jgi:predicted CoA-binding protein
MKKTLILGASTNPTRYSYLVANKLVRKGYDIINVGRKKGEVAGVEIDNTDTVHSDVDTITLYVGPANQEMYYSYILETKPNRVIFNPGTENAEFQKLLQDAGIDFIEACTLVMLNTNQY